MQCQKDMTTAHIEVENWRDHLIDSWDGIRRVLADTRRIAVLGIKEGDHRPAYFVPEYAQLSVYMRLLGLVQPSALPPKQRTAVELPAPSLPAYAGVYQLDSGVELEVTLREGALYVRSSAGGEPVRLWPESPTDFFVKEVDAQITFRRDAGGRVTGLVLHQFFRHRPGTRIR